MYIQLLYYKQGAMINISMQSSTGHCLWVMLLHLCHTIHFLCYMQHCLLSSGGVQVLSNLGELGTGRGPQGGLWHNIWGSTPLPIQSPSHESWRSTQWTIGSLVSSTIFCHCLVVAICQDIETQGEHPTCALGVDTLDLQRVYECEYHVVIKCVSSGPCIIDQVVEKLHYGLFGPVVSHYIQDKLRIIGSEAHQHEEQEKDIHVK